jgi:hypothetical protein
MFSVDEATAAVIRQVFEDSGELSAVNEHRRHFPALKDPALRACDRRMEAATSPSREAAPRVPYQITLVGPCHSWIIMRDLPEYPGSLAARLVTDAPTPWVIGSRCWDGSARGYADSATFDPYRVGSIRLL